ncbi:hypothetical protein [Caulobacter sp. 17J80-11]|uniref:hypothetical protein n=1 Tax=Caulobacter sp. 17J80-11 TaxID=2763502 RepID=UPI00165348E1|nr:hypothetical protein [Caulobacter sp. 17J80-11]MBC6982732.1 hypothetical protein [Caulobacter sp. 17J80-11]
MATRLKVYRTQIGFFDTIVAAPSQKAARAAWDVREDLFASGAAGVTEDPEAVKAALAHPGVVLRRAVGTDGPFTAGDAALPKVPSLPRPKPTTRDKSPELVSPPPPPPPPKPKPDRSALDAAERAREAVEREADEALAALAVERRALDRREAALRTELEARRDRAERELAQARAAWRKGGGD